MRLTEDRQLVGFGESRFLTGLAQRAREDRTLIEPAQRAAKAAERVADIIQGFGTIPGVLQGINDLLDGFEAGRL